MFFLPAITVMLEKLHWYGKVKGLGVNWMIWQLEFVLQKDIFIRFYFDHKICSFLFMLQHKTLFERLLLFIARFWFALRSQFGHFLIGYHDIKNYFFIDCFATKNSVICLLPVFHMLMGVSWDQSYLKLSGNHSYLLEWSRVVDTQ